MQFYSPFEQFIINPIVSIKIGFIDCTISTITLAFFILINCIIIFTLLIKNSKNETLYAISTKIEGIIHLLYSTCQLMVERHIPVKYHQQVFFPIIFSLASFLLIINLIGNIPGYISITSQIGFVCAFALTMITGYILVAIYTRKFTILRTFHAHGTSKELALLLFPIEVLTYVMRPFSLICRLVANFMSGHIILKVILGGIFSFSFSSSSSSLIETIITSLGIYILIPLIILEIAISVIQVYVFIVVFSMFLSDTFGHHYRH